MFGWEKARGVGSSWIVKRVRAFVVAPCACVRVCVRKGSGEKWESNIPPRCVKDESIDRLPEGR